MTAQPTKVYRLLPAAAAALVMLIPAGQAASANDDPFGDAVQVADAQLDTMRGGFEIHNFNGFGQHSAMLPFGINVTFQSRETLNGVPQGNNGVVASFSVSNKNSTTGQLDPNTPITVTLNNVNTGSPTSTIGSGATNVSTTLTSSGIVTLIQNTQPNVTLQTQQVITAQTQGMIQNVLKGGHILVHPITIFH